MWRWLVELLLLEQNPWGGELMLRWLKSELNTVFAALMLASLALGAVGGCDNDDKDTGYETGN